MRMPALSTHTLSSRSMLVLLLAILLSCTSLLVSAQSSNATVLIPFDPDADAVWSIALTADNTFVYVGTYSGHIYGVPYPITPPLLAAPSALYTAAVVQGGLQPSFRQLTVDPSNSTQLYGLDTANAQLFSLLLPPSPSQPAYTTLATLTGSGQEYVLTGLAVDYMTRTAYISAASGYLYAVSMDVVGQSFVAEAAVYSQSTGSGVNVFQAVALSPLFQYGSGGAVVRTLYVASTTSSYDDGQLRSFQVSARTLVSGPVSLLTSPLVSPQSILITDTNTAYILDGGYDYGYPPPLTAEPNPAYLWTVQLPNASSTTAAASRLYTSTSDPLHSGVALTADENELLFASLSALNSIATPPQPSANASLCLLFYSLPGSPEFPWSSAVSLRVQYSPTPIATASGSAVRLISATGARTYTNKLGQSTSVTVALLPPASYGGNNNYLYLSATLPFDVQGVSFSVSSNVTLPGHEPLVSYGRLHYYAQTVSVVSSTAPNVTVTYVTEDASSRIDADGSAFLSSVPNFRNRTLGGGNANIGAVQYATCRAPITFANGIRSTVSPTTANGGVRVQYNYFVSDGATYSITANLTLTMDSALATHTDVLANQYQLVTDVTGTRTYVYLPTGATVNSVVSGVSSDAYQYGDQRFYPYALLGSGAAIYTVNTAPFVDYGGIEFNISPGAPAAGQAPGVGTLYSVTSVYTEARELSPVLVDGYLSPSNGFFSSGPTGVPVQRYQQQQYAVLG